MKNLLIIFPVIIGLLLGYYFIPKTPTFQTVDDNTYHEQDHECNGKLLALRVYKITDKRYIVEHWTDSERTKYLVNIDIDSAKDHIDNEFVKLKMKECMQ